MEIGAISQETGGGAIMSGPLLIGRSFMKKHIWAAAAALLVGGTIFCIASRTSALPTTREDQSVSPYLSFTMKALEGK